MPAVGNRLSMKGADLRRPAPRVFIIASAIIAIYYNLFFPNNLQSDSIALNNHNLLMFFLLALLLPNYML